MTGHGSSQIDAIELLEHVLELVGEVLDCRGVNESAARRAAGSPAFSEISERARLHPGCHGLSRVMAIRTRAAATLIHCLRNVADPRHMSSSNGRQMAGMSESEGTMSARSRDRGDGASRYGEKPKATTPDTLT